MRAPRRTTTIEILTPDFLRKPGALEARGRGQRPTCSTTISKRCRGNYHDGASRRALFPIDPPVAAGQGARSVAIHEVGHHGRPGRIP
jgi:hypothetical protein